MKHILSATFLLASLAAHAQSSQWTLSYTLSYTFSYTGFYDREGARFLPAMTLSGSFSGVDSDGDGALERDELTSLTVGATDYLACAAGSNATYHCGADSFRFSPDGGLSFSVGEYGGDPGGWVGSGRVVTTGDGVYDYRFTPVTTTEHHLDWSAATTLNVLSAVPEPASWSMLAAGLAGVGLYRRRRA